MFDTALFFICLTLCANFRDYILSSKWQPSRLIVHIRHVFELPPRLSFKRYVNFESRNGTCFSAFVSAFITLPKEVKLWLIFLASSSTFPVAPVLPILSDPAKSTRFSFAFLMEPSVFICLYSSTNIVWLRELRSFIPVYSTWTRFYPI